MLVQQLQSLVLLGQELRQRGRRNRQRKLVLPAATDQSLLRLQCSSRVELVMDLDEVLLVVADRAQLVQGLLRDDGLQEGRLSEFVDSRLVGKESRRCRLDPLLVLRELKRFLRTVVALVPKHAHARVGPHLRIRSQVASLGNVLLADEHVCSSVLADNRSGLRYVDVEVSASARVLARAVLRPGRLL